MGSITDALKAKGATGSNIAECIETLPSSGGGSGIEDNEVFLVTLEYNNTTSRYDADRTYAEILEALTQFKYVVLTVKTASYGAGSEPIYFAEGFYPFSHMDGYDTKRLNFCGVRSTSESDAQMQSYRITSENVVSSWSFNLTINQ